MRIERLTVDGFGHFHDRDFGPLDPRLTVFQGPNEAGKSTLLEFLRTMLFGFDRSWRSTYPPRAGGRHGGRAVVVDGNGARYIIDRTARENGGLLNFLREADGAREEEGRLAAMLGGASREAYREVFAFGLDELQKLEQLGEGDVAAQIYSAGMGAHQLPAALRKLDEEQRKLFLKGGSKHEIAAIRDRLRQVDEGLERVAGDSETYHRLGSRKAELEDALERLSRERAGLARREAHLRIIEQAWDDWVEREQLREALAATVDRPGFPAGAVARLERLETEVRNAERNRRAAEQRLATAEETAAREVPDRALLELATEIEELREELGRYRAFATDLPKLETTLEERRRNQLAELAGIGPDWDVARVEATDTSETAESLIDEARVRLAGLESRVQAAQESVANARLSNERARLAEEEARAVLETLDRKSPDLSNLSERRRALRTARTLLQEYLVTKARLEGAPATPLSSTPVPGGLWPAAALGLAAILALAAGALAGGAMLAILTVVAVLAGTVASWMVVRSHQQSSGQAASASTPDPAASVAAALDAFERHSSRWGIDRPEWAAIEDAEAGLESLDQLANERSRATETAKAADRDLRLSKELLDRETQAQVRALDEHTRALAEWHAWLLQQNLPPARSPQVTASLLARVRTLATEARALNEIEHRVVRIAEEMSRYRERLDRVIRAGNLSFQTGSDAQAPVVANAVIARFEAARKAASDHEAARKAAEAARVELEQRSEEEAAARAELEKLFEMAAVNNGEELRSVAEAVEERRKMKQSLEDREGRLRRLSGPGDGYEKLLQELRGTAPEAVAEELRSLDEELARIDGERDELNRESGEVSRELSTLASDHEGSRLRAERESLVETLRVKAREWARARLAQTLLERARARYEQERQPDVVKAAEEYFAQMTGGRYTRLHVPLGTESRTIQAWGSEASELEPKQLSRGTREQLYLALRFGLIEQFGKAGARLPIIVDDALVNFDPARMAAAARAFASLSERNQVIVFTCHPHLVEIFKGAYAETRVIEIGNGVEHEPPAGAAARLL